MRRALFSWLMRFGVVLVLLSIAGGLVLISGVVPIKASARHWEITAWVLDFAKRRSVATHTLAQSAPKLDEPWLVLKGAGQYESACRPCHGAPDLRNPMVPAQMTPYPPALAPLVGRWEPEELFYIVKHGIKFTGMPAWPSLIRDDEVAAMVAFLLVLPRLDAREYRRWVDGEPVRPDAVLEPLRELPGPGETPLLVIGTCARCHGLYGEARENAAFPKLAGQPFEYLSDALHAYAQGERYSGIMQPLAAALTPRERDELARYFSVFPGRIAGSETSSDAAAIARGRLIAEQGIPARGVPACRECHGPVSEPRNPHYPKLAGQFADYLVLQLRLFQQGKRGGSAYAHLMRQIAPRLREGELRDVALYYASETALESAVPRQSP